MNISFFLKKNQGFGWYLTQLERFALQRWRNKYNLSQESQPSVLMEKTPAYFVTPEARVGLKQARVDRSLLGMSLC